MALCTIVVPVYNRAALTERCLAALLGGLGDEGVPAEVVVVDDGSTDATPAMLADYADRVRVVSRPANGGFATACNDGAAVARGEYLVFLNNDTLPQRGWLAALARFAEQRSSAAVVGSKLLYPDGSIQHAGTVICQDRYPRHIYAGFPAEHPAVNRSRRFQVVTGACMLVRRRAFEAVSGFDTAFRNAYEDHDLCLRLGERGHEVWYCHESVLVHLEYATRVGRTADFEHSTRLYETRWRDRVAPDDLGYYQEDGLLRFAYDGVFPLRLAVSPLLAAIEDRDQERPLDSHLLRRSRQVFALRRENAGLSLELEQVRQDAGHREVPAPIVTEARPDGPTPAPATGERSADLPLANGEREIGPASTRGRFLPARLKQALAPCLGVLRQYPPRTLVVPARYAQARPAAAPPLISIVTASLNQAEFIERTIRSVLGQGYPRLEYIVQDGGSCDGTAEIVERYRSVLAHAESGPDGGLAQALNRGFGRTAGEIMAYLNSDDLLLPGALHYVSRYFERHPEVDVVYSHRVILDERDAEIGRWILPPHDDTVLAWADFIPQETLFWRRRAWQAAGGQIDESFAFAVDWDLLLRFQAAGARFARLPRFLGAFRVHPRQKTSAELTDLGAREMARLRERCHGREVSDEEIHRQVRPYLWRHVTYDRLYRLGVLRY